MQSILKGSIRAIIILFGAYFYGQAPDAKVTLDDDQENFNGSVSSLNYWVGAKIGYNFVGDSDDNFFVGSASLAINLLDLKPGQKQDKEGETYYDKRQFGIVGNLGNFKFSESEDNSEDLNKLAQSINGISLGLGYTYQFKEKDLSLEVPQSVFRWFARAGVRYSSFDDVGDDNETVNLAQFATNLGLEWELYGFKNGGALSISTGLSQYFFDNSLYEKVFDKDKGSLTTFDISLTLPLSKTLGLYTNGTFAPDTSAAYLMGLIIKPQLDPDGNGY